MQRPLVVMVVLALGLAPALALEHGKRSAQDSRGLVSPDQQLGKAFRVSADDLPAPHATPAVTNPARSLPFKGHTPKLPEGFTATLFAKLQHPRRMLVLPNGDIVVAEQQPGHLTLLRVGADGKAQNLGHPAQGFNEPYGLAWRDGEILVADQDGIWRVPHTLSNGRNGQEATANAVSPDERKPSRAVNRQRLLTQKGVFGSARGHANRPLAIDPKTGALFVGVGSIGNLGIEPQVKATIQRFEPDGGGQTTYVAGVRNPSGLTINPQTGALWAVVQERDGMGDKLVPDFMIRAEAGAFYGWPYAYTGDHPQPGFASKAPEKVNSSRLPDLLFQSHSSAMDLVFYDGGLFPAADRGSAFVVLKGSWNRSDPTGYKVVRVPVKDGQLVGSYENFMTGFWVSGRTRAEVWGRPAAIAVGKDGALFVADDLAGTIWRVTYDGPQRRAGSEGSN